MTGDQHVLVVGGAALESNELRTELERRAHRGPVRAFLLVPTPSHEREAVHARLTEAVSRWSEAGIITVGIIGKSDPVAAVRAIWNPAFYDEILVCAPPAPISSRLRVDLARRIGRLTAAKVSFIAAPSAPPARPSDAGRHGGVSSRRRLSGRPPLAALRTARSLLL